MEAITGDTEYRAIAVINTNATDTLYNAVLYCEDGYTEGSSYTRAEFALDTGTQTIVDESTVPSNPSLTFTTNIGEENGLSLAILRRGQKSVFG